MKNLLPLFLFLSFSYGTSQTYLSKKQIDSINHLPYNNRIETSYINIQRYKTTLRIAQETGYTFGEAESLSNLSLIYYYKGLYDLSIEYFFKAVDVFETIEETGKIGELYGLYGYRLRDSNIDKAEEFMLKGIKMSESVNNEEVLRGMNDNYGLIKQAKKQYDSAFFYFNKSLKKKEAANDLVGIPYSLNKIASLKTILGDYKEAKELFDRAYNIRKKLEDNVGLAENLSFYGSYYESLGDYDAAIRYFIQALEKSKAAGYNWLTFKIYGALSTNSELKKDYQGAYGYLQQHLHYKNSLYSLETKANRDALEVQFETKEKEKQILEQRAEIAENKLNLERKNKLVIGVIFISLFILFIILQFYRVQRLKNQQLIKENKLKDSLIKIETQNRIQEERLRISRDLHDNIGSQLIFITMALEKLKTGLKTAEPEIQNQISELNNFTKSTIDELRDTIWAMNKDRISIEDLRTRIINFIEKAKFVSKKTKINYRFPDSVSTFSFSAFEGVNIYRIIQESIQNVLKHADASELSINVEEHNNRIIFSINDNGKGFNDTGTSFGNGLLIMRKRAGDIGANLLIQSETQEGTKIELSV